MRKKAKKRMNPLPLALCAAAAISGAWLGIVQFAMSRMDAKRESVPAQTGGEARQIYAVPAPAPRTAVMEDAVEKAQKPKPGHEARAKPQPKPKTEATAKHPVPGPAKKKPDLSAYTVNAIRSDGKSLLPKDTSLSVKDLNQRKLDAAKDKDQFTGGNGLLGDVYRGTKKFVDKVDEATLNASQKALGSVAKPNKATLRPSGGGVKLHLEIPPETVKLGR